MIVKVVQAMKIQQRDDVILQDHILDMIPRRPECGSPCHLCENSCPVQAIAPSGKINMNDCFQCLDCEVEYYDDSRCPPLIFKKKDSLKQSKI